MTAFYRSAGPDGRPFNKDPLNAIWEQVFGRPYVPQKPRYAQPVVISPDSFGWSAPDGPVRARHSKSGRSSAIRCTARNDISRAPGRSRMLPRCSSVTAESAAPLLAPSRTARSCTGCGKSGGRVTVQPSSGVTR